MSRRAQRLATRVAAGRIRSGDGRGIITYRHHTRLSGPDPAVNPPRAVGLVVNGAHLAGVATLNVRASPLIGRFIAGDILRLGDAILTVASQVVAAGNAAALPLTAPLPAPASDGATLTPEWLNERRVAAEITGLGTRIPDGQLIQARDLFLAVAAAALPWEPANGDRVTLPSGDTREVVAVTPVLVDGTPITYRLQVR